MPSTSAGIGAQSYTKFLSSAAGQPFKDLNSTLTNYYKDKNKTTSAPSMGTYKFQTGANDVRDALSALKAGQKLDLGKATDYQKAELNRQYLQSLRRDAQLAKDDEERRQRNATMGSGSSYSMSLPTLR